MRNTRYPTFVNLKELEDTGEEFQFSNLTGELNIALADLIKKHPFNIEISLRSMGNAYEITGKIETQLDLICSRCGREMVENIKENFNELIVVDKEKPRAGHNGHTGSHEHGPFCNYTTSYQFDLAEFTHEHIAAAEPYAPKCKLPDCEAYFLAAQAAIEAPITEVETNPFAVLKNMNSKGQRD